MNMKCVMIIDSDLPVGVQVNTAAALGISLASGIKGLTGKNVLDRDGKVHEGVTNIPIPILTMSKEELKRKYEAVLEKREDGIKLIGFNDVAQKSACYDDYEMKLALTNHDQINFLGICIYGSKQSINRLTGNIKMLR